MIESSKYNRENYPRKCFWTQERETRVKFNPGLSTNRPSNNWAQVYFPGVFAARKKPFNDVWLLASTLGITIPPAAQAILAYELAQFGFLYTRVVGEFFTRLASLAFYVRKSSSACSAQASLPIILNFHAVLLTRREL